MATRHTIPSRETVWQHALLLSSRHAGEVGEVSAIVVIKNERVFNKSGEFEEFSLVAYLRRHLKFTNLYSNLINTEKL